jgi:SHS2 domain-containing protein
VGYAWGEHVGELELRLEADDEPGIFAAAVAAFAELLAGEEDDGAPTDWFDVRADGGDRAALLAAWLDELVFLAEHERLVPVTVEGLTLDATGVSGRVGGHRGEPPHLVKAVTYHRLAFEPGAGGFHATAVLDV